MKFALQKFRKGDEVFLQKNINDKEISHNTLYIKNPYTIEYAKSWVNRNLQLYKKKNANEVNFVIDIDGEVAGSVSITSIDLKNKKAEIGYWLSRKYWGQGIMTSAVKEIVGYGFTKLKLQRLSAGVFSFNKQSARVLEKARFFYA